MRLLTVAAELLLAASAVSAAFVPSSMKLGTPPLRAEDVPAPEGALSKRAGSWPIHVAYFDQLLDHSNPSLGTFKQRYFYNYEYYAGPGSPIILNSPGENASDNYTAYATNLTLAGNFAKSTGGAVILLEHRYWGQSSPYEELSTDNMQYLTLDNSIQDLIYFANNVNFTFDPTGSSRPDKAPWVLTGCSYSGALSAWVHALAPGTFWIHHCSSAVVQTSSNFWQYYNIIHDAMPQNCSTDYTKVIAHVDKVLMNGTAAAKTKLKKKFGFGDWINDEDFASAMMDGLGYEQSLSFDAESYGAEDKFHGFCDYVENRWPGSSAPQPGPEGVGLCAAINGLSKWFKEKDLPGCSSWGYSRWTKDDDLSCYISDDATSPVYTDKRVYNPINRQWQWMLCNEPFEWWRTGPPAGQPRMVSQLVTPDYWRRQCKLFFPETNGHTPGVERGLRAESINAVTGGWTNVNTTRLMWSNFDLDPWRPVTVSADDRPGGPLASTDEHPVRVVPGATHCSDMILHNAQANAGLMKVFEEQLDNVNKWVADFYREHQKPWPKHN